MYMYIADMCTVYIQLCLIIEIIRDITENVISPLFLSAVPSDLSTPDFVASVNATLADITSALNGNDVDLTQTLSDYFLAVS